MPFATTTKISGPIAISKRPDVDLGGLHFSYKVGLMYPSQAAVNTTAYVGPPPIATLNQPATPSGNLH
ncbi:MAG TPA: hypothetical protein VH164_13215 [Ktedonobacteraceae bacterium]|jgi:hypothetical protein|nr:hypothetical protein [Ktedonobacteraceae bacterium]